MKAPGAAKRGCDQDDAEGHQRDLHCLLGGDAVWGEVVDREYLSLANANSVDRGAHSLPAFSARLQVERGCRVAKAPARDLGGVVRCAALTSVIILLASVALTRMRREALLERVFCQRWQSAFIVGGPRRPFDGLGPFG